MHKLYMYICIWLLAFGLNQILFTHRNHKLSKQEQETQKQYAYLSVTYIHKMTITQTHCWPLREQVYEQAHWHMFYTVIVYICNSE